MYRSAEPFITNFIKTHLVSNILHAWSTYHIIIIVKLLMQSYSSLIKISKMGKMFDLGVHTRNCTSLFRKIFVGTKKDQIVIDWGFIWCSIKRETSPIYLRHISYLWALSQTSSRLLSPSMMFLFVVGKCKSFNKADFSSQKVWIDAVFQLIQICQVDIDWRSGWYLIR